MTVHRLGLVFAGGLAVLDVAEVVDFCYLVVGVDLFDQGELFGQLVFLGVAEGGRLAHYLTQFLGVLLD